MYRVTVFGAANVDISATAQGPFRMYDSNPGLVQIDFGGVGRNIAHNLCLLGAQVDFVTVFGDDMMSQTLHDDCQRLGMQLGNALCIRNARSNYFVCLNDTHGDMQAGVADVELLQYMTPKHVGEVLRHSDTTDAVVADCNLREDSLAALAAAARGTVYVDATSAAKSVKIRAMLSQPRSARLVVKANRLEAQQISGIDTDAATMAERMIGLGAGCVYITLGSEGVFCHDGREGRLISPVVTNVVNATGAGDAFIAGVVMGELHGKDSCDAAIWGRRAAGLALSSPRPVNPNMCLDCLENA